VDHYKWDAKKNEQLRADRGVSFDQVVMHIERGEILDIYEHPNRAQYPNQQVLVVEIEGYAYLVPFVESAAGRFLKTIIPSRKATRRYLGEKNEEDETR
jgi:uncharacterized DUF497 family protein